MPIRIASQGIIDTAQASDQLYVIDGELATYEQVQQLAPADIAQISILKNEPPLISCSISWQRAIIITTKAATQPRPTRKRLPEKPLIPLSEIR